MKALIYPSALLLTAALLHCSGQGGGGMPPPPAEVGPVPEREILNSSVFIATIRSRDSADIRPQVTGRVTEILVRSGEEVDRGKVLMRIDQSRQRAALSQAEAATAQAGAELQRARADLAALKASRTAQATEVAYSRRQLDRLRKLFAADNVSREEFDRSSANVESAEARLEALDAQIRAQEAAIRGLRSSVSQRSSQVEEGQAELQFYNVVAGIDGKLGDIPVRVGDLVSQSTLLTTVEGAQTRELLVQIPAEQASQLQPGLQVEVRDGRDRLLETLRVGFISPSVDPVTQTLLAKAPIPVGSSLTPGKFVRSRVIWERTVGPAVPTTAVLRLNTQPFVFRVEEGNPPTVKQLPVELGPLQDQYYLVQRGLDVGDRIVLKGIQRLRDGGPVTPTQPEGSSALSPTSTPTPSAR